jgi:hypothetical protein
MFIGDLVFDSVYLLVVKIYKIYDLTNILMLVSSVLLVCIFIETSRVQIELLGWFLLDFLWQNLHHML